MDAQEAYEIGKSDGAEWFRQRDSSALVGNNEHMISDDFYPAYVRGIADGIREADEQ